MCDNSPLTFTGNDEEYLHTKKSFVPLSTRIKPETIYDDVDKISIRELLERNHKDFDYLRDRVSVLIEKIGPVLNEQKDQTPVPAGPKPLVTSFVASSLSSLDSQIMSLAYQVEYVTAQIDL